MAGTLYLIPTPLGEIAPQACLPASALAHVNALDLFFAEVPKSARAFLKAAGVERSFATIEILTLTNDTPEAAIREGLAKVAAGRNAGMLSEAGAPAIADPGAMAIRIAHGLGIRVVPLVGPSAISLALMASGLNGQRFGFHGYLPVKQPDLGRRIVALERDSKTLDQTQIFIETPYRNTRLFEALIATCQPNTWLSIATDLTLETESITTRTIASWRSSPPSIERRPSVFLMLAAR